MAVSPLRNVLDAANAARESFLEKCPVSSYRLAHDEADGLCGLTVDRYEKAWLVEQHRAQAPAQELVEALVERVGPQAPVFLKHRYCRDEARRSGAQVSGPPLSPQLVAREGELQFVVNLARGEHTNLFLDGRAARRFVRDHASGKRVLNLFAYTGAFGAAAAIGGARSTTNVDNKKTVLRIARENYQLNNAPADTRSFLVSEAIAFLRKAKKRTEAFDMVILDPPPRFDLPQGRRFDARSGYARLVARSLTVVADGGMLLAGLNALAVSDTAFEAAVDEGAQLAGRHFREKSWVLPDPDFPPCPSRPSARFLACSLVSATCC